MHMHIGSNRHPIEDVPVVYMVEPTPQNLETITSDLQKGLYSPAYLNFLSSIPRPLLEGKRQAFPPVHATPSSLRNFPDPPEY